MVLKIFLEPLRVAKCEYFEFPLKKEVDQKSFQQFRVTKCPRYK